MATSAQGDFHIDALQLKKASVILRAVNHPLRQQLLKLLHEHGKMIVTDIFTKLHLEQSIASQHLAILRKSGFVSTSRNGKFVYYTINYKKK